MKTFLEVEGKMVPIPQLASSQYRPLNWTQTLRSGRTMLWRKERGHWHKRFRASTAPKSGETAMQPPATVSKVPEAPENKPPPLEKAQVHESTLWPGAGRMSGNLFEERNWLLPPNYLNNNHKNATNPKSPMKEEPQTGQPEKCGWGPNCPFCKNQEKEDWDGKHQSQLQKVLPLPEVQRPQARCPQTLNYQKTQSTQKSTQETQLGKYQTQTKKQWEAEMERLNSKYNLDYSSNSELDSESDEGEQHQYEHGYETLI